jgi:hypothetical protein
MRWISPGCLLLAGALSLVLGPVAVTARADEPVASGIPAGKRVAPPDVTPVRMGSIRIEAIHWGRERGLDQNGGYIAAISRKTGKELWLLKVYDISYDTQMETDVQDVFIERMERLGSHAVLVTDEGGRQFEVDIDRKKVVPR